MSEAAEHVAAKVSTIGKYRLIASLGQGGMAKVYLALMAGPAGFNKLLVIKALRDDMKAAGEEYVAMFLDEARLAARLNHPNVVQTYEVGEGEGRYFIAMEYLEGQAWRTIQRRMAPDGLPLEEQLRVLAETARGLHYAHELKGYDGEPLNVVHRDVSPQNVFLTYDGRVKLLDFGIAKTQDAEHMTKVGVIKGKVDYIAPEQVRGEPLDRRADVFALGAMMWEAISGQRFAGGPKVADVTKIHNRVTAAEPRLREITPDTPERLLEICDKALSLDPEERHATAEAFANELDAYLSTTDYKPSSKTLGALVTPAFEHERDKLHALIDKQVQLVQSQGPQAFSRATGQLPKLDPVLTTRTGSGVWETGRTDSGSLPDLSHLSRGSLMSGTSELGPAPASGGVPKGVALLLVGAAMAAAAFLGIRGEPTAPRTHAASVTPRPAEPRAPSSTTAQGGPGEGSPQERRAAEQPAEAAAAPKTVQIRLEVDPPTAEATLDGASLPQLPFEANLTKDGKLHELAVRAPGYEPIKQVLTFDRDQHVSLRLKPAKRRRGKRDAEEPTGTTDEREQPAAKAKPKRDKRQQMVAPGQDLIGSTPRRAPTAPKIDFEDPYQ